MLRLGIIFKVTGVIAVAWALLACSGHLPGWATKNHPSARLGLIIGVVLLVTGVPLLVVALRSTQRVALAGRASGAAKSRR
jgi:hypothetical protein